ncbi:CRACD-like protein isoform X3 [Cetorhinus maximus]
MATGLTDSKIHETESPSDDGSGKKKSKFKSFKKLFVKKKKKEFVVNATKTSLKQSQSTSDVTSPASCTPDLGNDQGTYKSIMGIRALSHDSIFIPDTSVQQPVKPVRVFSQESVSGPIKALQLKVQDNIKLGPPPMSIPAKKTEDTGASSEDDGLPRSPQESSPLHEILARSYLAKISPGSSSRPNSPLSAIVPTRSSSRSWSPTSPTVQISSSDSFVSPAIDFNSPPTFPICLDNSAARHKLSVKPRNQRSSSKRRRPPLRLLSEGPSEFMYNVPELREENEQEISNYNAENANSDISLKDRTEIPSTILTRGQTLLLTEPTMVRSSSTEVVDNSEQGMDELIHVDIAASTVVLDVSDHLKASSVPAVLSETEEDVNLMEFEIVEVAATQIPMLPGSTIALSEDPTQIDFIDPLKQEEEINLSGSEMKSTAYDTHAVSIDTSFAKETVYQTSTVIPSDMLSLDSEKPLSNAPIGTEINEVEFVQVTPETSCKQTKVAATSNELSFSEACSIRQAAKELSDHEDRSNEVPEEFSSIASACTEVHSRPAETSQTAEDLPVSETVNSGPENMEITGFKEANVKISEDKTISQENSFKKNNQGSFKFSISSAWNRSKRDTKKWNEGDLTADSDISHNKFPQKASALPGKEKKEKDVEMPLSEPSVAKIDAHKPEKTEEAHGKVDDGRGLFGVKLRSTSHSLKYKESSHSEHKETVKRHSADATLDSGGSALQPKAEKMEVKKPLEVALGDTLKDDGKLKTKSSESLAVKPPLPKKPVLQSVNTTTTATEKPNKPVKPSQEKLKDTEKKSSVNKNSEKSVEVLQDDYCEEERGLLFEKHTQDNGSPIEGSSVPAWVTMARQKQKGYHVQHYSKEDKMPAQEAKAIANRKAMDKETLKSPTELKSGHHKPLSSCKAQDCKLELKSSVAEPQQRVSPIPSPVTVNKHSLAMPQNTSDKDGRDQYGKDKTSPSSSQPSWMELAKKKAKAWSDMPQIIK